MRLASYNLENLFDRPVALTGDRRTNGPILKAFERVNSILMKEVYTDTDKARILEALETLGLTKTDGSPYAWLRRNHGALVKRGKGGPRVVASGRSSWVGCVELRTRSVDEQATRNTARVIRDVHADVIATIEVEGRAELAEFNHDLVGGSGASPYAHVMAITGNDVRGITVGVMTGPDYPIVDIVSHVDDADDKGRVFSRDCAEYRIATPSGQTLLVLVNHLKSAGYGSTAGNDARRLRQAKRVAEIYRQRRAEGCDLVAIVGDFNATRGPSLAPLLDGTDLRDVSEHAAFDTGTVDGDPAFLGTWGGGLHPKKIDYVLLSPALFDRAVGGGIYRGGVFCETKRKPWESFADKPENEASDHAAIYADLGV